MKRKLIALAAMLPLAVLAQGVGIVRVMTTGDYKVPVAVWYPSRAPTMAWDAGPYRIEATRDAQLPTDRRALILLSHGSGGSELGHADLAEALARAGYIVAAPRHLGDSFDEPGGRGSDVQLIGRPWQAVAALDAVLADPRFKEVIDAKRIGMAGFSAGGYTTLVMAGARPDVRLHEAHCKAHPDDAELCSGGAQTTQRITRPGWALPQDARVRAAVAMAPLSVMFDAKGLAGVTISLRIYKAANDQLLQNRFNTDPLLRALPRPVEQGEVPGNHFVFLAPCSEALKAVAATICTDPPGVDRAAVHTTLNREIVDFFIRTLPP